MFVVIVASHIRLRAMIIVVKPSVQKFCDLMSCENSKVLSKLANFSKVIIAGFGQSE